LSLGKLPDRKRVILSWGVHLPLLSNATSECATLLQLSAILLRHVMTFLLTLPVIVLALSPADSDASAGTARPINRSNLHADRSCPAD
jgi:hypothetical protein